MEITPINWPPTFSVKKHKRARQIKLRTSKKSGLQITIPWRFNINHLPKVMEKHKDWIIKSLTELTFQKNHPLPDHFFLHGLQDKWKITYVACKSKLKMFTRLQNEIVLMGKLEDSCVKKLLINWLKQRAKIYLEEEIIRVSQQTNLFNLKLTIRDQQARWGSCSSAKAINLNYKLLFLPKNLVEHVLVHELCHLTYLNHSSQFWSLVAKFDPDWQQHKKLLRHASTYIPQWI